MDLVKSLTGLSDDKEQKQPRQGDPADDPNPKAAPATDPEQATDEQVANFLRHEYKSVRDDKLPNKKK